MKKKNYIELKKNTLKIEKKICVALHYIFFFILHVTFKKKLFYMLH